MASTTGKPIKGILKQSTGLPSGSSLTANYNGVSNSNSSTTTTKGISVGSATHSRRMRSQQENEEIARKHAAILQQRKDLEATIFQSIERLTDLPLHREPSFSSAHPSPEDVAVFTQLVRIFQPGDYDDLIEERNTCGLCGYCLCAKKHRVYAGKGTWKLVHHTGHKGGGGGGIVPKAELEKWCSSDCARRALYIKVQLNETAAWERVGIPDIVVELYKEEETTQAKGVKDAKVEKSDKNPAQDGKPTDPVDTRLAQGVAQLKIDEQRKQVQDATSLALERGDLARADIVGQKDDRLPPTAPRVDVQINEKKIVVAPREPALDKTGEAHLMTEGHKVKFGK